MRKVLNFLLILLFAHVSVAQQDKFSADLFTKYSEYKEKELAKRRIKRDDIQPLLEKLKADSMFSVQKVGESIDGRNLDLVSFGKGDIDVFLWSQMHGDESTATMAIFDILNFFRSGDFSGEQELMLKNLKIHFLPMLNPDGAERFSRRNSLGIDINRDALRLQSPEGKTLKRLRDSLDAEFGFNLHDQSKYYNAERTNKPASISFLAPAFNYEKDINQVRGNAMKVIVQMNRTLQQFAPGQVGRYNDDFEPRAFGDNIQKWGTSTILIESGGYQEDPEKQEIRKLNFVSILAALKAIASGDYKAEDLAEYEKIPNNDRMLFDLKLTGLTYHINEDPFILDLGINTSEYDLEGNSDFYYSGRIADQGDLSTSYGYTEMDASGFTYRKGKVYSEIISSKEGLEQLNMKDLLKQGYAYIKVATPLLKENYSKYPLNLVAEDFNINRILAPGSDANFFLYKNDQVEYAVINGFLTDLTSPERDIKNTLVIK